MKRKGALLTALAFILLSLLTASARAADPAPAGATDEAFLAFFPPARTQGKLPIVLHPNVKATGRVLVIGFGAPFPPGFVTDPERIAVLDSLGKEMAVHVKVLSRWAAPAPHAGSIRAVLIQFRDYLSSHLPRTYTLRWGPPRQAKEKRGWPARTGWLPVADGSYPPGAVMEPPVYVTLPPRWLGQCLLKGRINPAGAEPEFAWYHQALSHYFLTAINQTPNRLKPKFRIDYVTKSEPWLYDRAMTLFVTYIQQGGIEALRQAHRAAQFYASQIKPDGAFALLTGRYTRDVKFGYQECLALDHWLTGDPGMLAASGRVAQLLGAWNPHYETSRSFWTERHLGFLLLNAATAYELTRDPKMLAAARDAFEAAWRLQTSPPAGVPRGTGCLPHRGEQHAERVRGWYCSPWMTSLTADAMLRYYLITADPRVPAAIDGFARFVIERGLFRIQRPNQKKAQWAPMYLAPAAPDARPVQKRWTDQQHALDVARILAAAIYFSKHGRPAAPNLRAALGKLLDTARWDFKMSFSRTAPKFGAPQYPLTPPRKFNWWFRTTGDIGWLLAN